MSIAPNLLRQRPKRLFWYIGGGIVALAIGAILFVKLDPTDAAVFTDTVLRPVLGQRTVDAMEKSFFNLSDSVQRAQHAQPTAPLAVQEVVPTGHMPTIPQLNLAAIPPVTSFPALPGEGAWQIQSLPQVTTSSAAAYTFVRPDPERDFAFVTAVQFDMHALRLHSVAGTKEPGSATDTKGAGVIPDSVQQSTKLVAAFNGGFLYSNGNFGMMADGITYAPLKKHFGTLVAHQDGRLEIVNYDGTPLSSDVVFARQNCPILIENGTISGTDAEDLLQWGRTDANGVYTWRSGVGITKDGNLLYAAGNNVTHLTLAKALQMAGAVNAIQLDINPGWVRFNFFTPQPDGTYATATVSKDLKSGAKTFLKNSTKDFFYITAK